MNFPFGDKPIRIGMLGMTEGNAHPFSWGAMINGYDHEEMVKWTAKDYPTIPEYLAQIDSLCIDRQVVCYNEDGTVTLDL